MYYDDYMYTLSLNCILIWNLLMYNINCTVYTLYYSAFQVISIISIKIDKKIDYLTQMIKNYNVHLFSVYTK